MLRHAVHFQQNAQLLVVSSSFINVGNNNQKHVFTYIVYLDYIVLFLKITVLYGIYKLQSFFSRGHVPVSP